MERMCKILVLLVLGICFSVSIAEGSVYFLDIQGHWAQKSITAWVKKGYIDGYADGKFKPDQAITRAEFCAFINRLMGYNKVDTLRFQDVKGNEWYALEIGKAVTAGYLNGYPDGTIRPNQGITREEMASMLTQIFSLKYYTSNDVLKKFKDQEKISSWSKLAVNTVVYYKYMNGFKDKTFRAANKVTRAEALAIVDRIVETLYDQPGIYGLPYDTYTIKGNVFINRAGVTLRNVVINGDLYLTEGIGNGFVTLDNVKVKGTTQISGGAVINNSNLSTVLVKNTNNSKLRLLAQGTTKIGSVEVRTAAILEEANLSGSGFNNVLIKAPREIQIEMKGIFNQVNVESAKVQLEFLEGTMNSLTLALNARDTEVELPADTLIKKLTVVSKASIGGRGVINNAEVYGDGVTFDRAPQKIKVASGVKAKVNGKTVTGTKSYSSSKYYDSAPIFVGSYPYITDVHAEGFTLLLKASKACKAYYVVLDADERVPSADEVMAGEDADGKKVASYRRGNVSLSANKEKSVEIDDLKADREYTVYVVLYNSAVTIDPPVIRVEVTTKESAYGDLSGKVTDSQGNGLKDVKVTVKDGSKVIDSTTTKADGTYIIYDLPTGTYTVTFAKSGYVSTQTTKVKISEDKNTKVNKTMRLK